MLSFAYLPQLTRNSERLSRREGVGDGPSERLQGPLLGYAKDKGNYSNKYVGYVLYDLTG